MTHLDYAFYSIVLLNVFALGFNIGFWMKSKPSSRTRITVNNFTSPGVPLPTVPGKKPANSNENGDGDCNQN